MIIQCRWVSIGFIKFKSDKFYINFPPASYTFTVSEIWGEFILKGSVEERALSLGSYIAENGATVRSAAKKFGISKSTVHKDVTERLEKLNKALFEEVRAVLDKNKAERHMRGGEATKQKYINIKEV